MVVMLIIMWGPKDGEIRELWRLERTTTLEACLTMNKIFSVGGRAAVAFVRCDVLDPKSSGFWPVPGVR